MSMLKEVMEKLYKAVIGRDKEGHEEMEKTPNYNQIYLAYSRCFVETNGAYHVGNHRLVEGFSPARAIAALALNKKNGYPLPITTCKMISGGYALFISTSGEALNMNIPLRDVQQTAQNFASELSREYSKHLRDVLAEAEP